MQDQNHQTVQMPVSKLSYSALTQLLRNPLIFKLKHILNVYDGKMSVGGMIGRAGHEALKAYHGGNPEVLLPDDRAEAIRISIQVGMDYLDGFVDAYIDYGKTGSREAMLQGYIKAMNFFFAEEPEYHEILICEEKLEGELETVDGQKMPLPAVGIPDLVHQRKDGGVEIIDYKFVKSFTDYDDEDYIKIIQSQFLWHLLRVSRGITADRMLFREIKTSENMRENQGKPQIRDYAIPLNHEPYRIIFYNIYRDVVRFLANPDSIYLPNLSDPFDGEQAGLLYAQGLLNSDMSDVEVMHKVKDVALVSKKFVPSSLDRIENRRLDPAEKIKLRLAEFGIPVEPQETVVGTSVTQYRFKVSAGIRMSVFAKHIADIARALEAKGAIKVLAPIPGTDLVGIEVANEQRSSVTMGKQHLTSDTLMLPIGVDVNGQAVKADLADMPHLLIAGSTGSGKSVLIHSLITAMTEQLSSRKLHLVLIDPKRVELVAFSKKPHLRGRIIYEHDEAAAKLMALTETMEERYQLLEEHGCRNIKEYNQKASKKLHYIVVVIDEFADLILRSKIKEKTKGKKQTTTVTKKKGVTITQNETTGGEVTVEDCIVRLAQMARATGIHLIIATQRPSVDVITGIIKSNFPARIALTTSSVIDSRVIMDEEGAEKLSGKGDMILKIPGKPNVRLQGFLTE